MTNFIEAVVRVLKEAQQDDALVSLYQRSAETGTFLVGVVLCVSKTHTCLGEIDEGGRENGCSVVPIADTFRVERDDAYLKRIRKLYSTHTQGMSSYKAWALARDMEESAEPLSFRSILRVLADLHALGTIYFLDGTSDTGYVKSVTDEGVQLDMVESDGSMSGKSLSDMSFVRKVCFGGDIERRLLLPEGSTDIAEP